MALEGTTTVLHDIDLGLDPRGYTAVMGRSGSGKFTLPAIIGLLEPPSAGDYTLNHRPVTNLDDTALAAQRASTFGFVFQEFHPLDGLTAADNVMLAREPTSNLDTTTRDETLDLFDAMHRDGEGIIVVTHDPEVARRAHRIVRLRDGRVREQVGAA